MPEIAGHATMSGKAVYDMIHGGPGTWTMDRAHDAAKAQSTTQHEINDEIHSIAGEIRASWTGDAAEGANGATRPLSDGALMSSMMLDSAYQVHATQGQHFSHTYNSVEPVADSPPETGTWDSMTPWDTDTEDAVNRHNAASRRNVELYHAYGDTSDASTSGMPTEYARFPEFNGDFAVAANQDGPGGGSQVAPPQTGNSTAAASYNPGGGTAAAPGAAGQPATAGAPLPGGGQQQAPGPTMGSGPTGTGAPPSGTGPAAPGGGVPRGGINPGLGAAALAGGAMGAGAAGDDSVRSGRGIGARGGSGSGGGGTAAGRGATGAPGQGAGTGARTGAAPGAAAAAEAAAARGAASGPAGRAGAAGAPLGAGAGRGQGGDDEDHQRKTVLEEPDAEGLFGTDQMTAPPVIGTDPGPER